MNKLICAYKPPFISSNAFLTRLKKQEQNKKAGFSGTLDPFARGALIVGFGQYTRLFRFLQKTPKIYEATIFLGAISKSLDCENVQEVRQIKHLDLAKIKDAILGIKGKQMQSPPSFSAKKINGTRAYNLARKNENFSLKKTAIEVFESTFLNYSHPFLSFRVSVSEGTYVRVLAQDILKALHSVGTLVSLTRISEGAFFYQNNKPLDPSLFLTPKENKIISSKNTQNGDKLALQDLMIKTNGTYFIKQNSMLSIIEINSTKVQYLLNSIRLPSA